MSVTNPDKVVTKQDLADFYGEIFPYLGGMPEMVINKFSKGDLYSTEEKMIGQWIDGKPIYQKVFTGTTPASSSNNDELFTPNDGFEIAIGANVDKFVSFSGFVQLESGRFYQLATVTQKSTVSGAKVTNTRWFTGWVVNNTHSSTPNVIKLGVGSDSSLASRPYYVIVQYTKITDSATSIGVDTDYSTTEKIVGTWIDGKPIYQKTFTGTITAATTAGSPVSTYVSIGASVAQLVSLSGSYKNATNDFIMPVVVNNDYSKNSYITVFVGSNSSTVSSNKNKIVFVNCRTASFTYYVTLQYTKTTD